jgi:hypothetical protein
MSSLEMYFILGQYRDRNPHELKKTGNEAKTLSERMLRS